MAVGKSPKQVGLVGSSASYCGPRLSETSVYSLLHRESHRLFPDESFADLFDDVGRRSIPPQIVAVVNVRSPTSCGGVMVADVHESAAVNGSGQTSQFFVQPKTSNGSQS